MISDEAALQTTVHLIARALAPAGFLLMIESAGGGIAAQLSPIHLTGGHSLSSAWCLRVTGGGGGCRGGGRLAVLRGVYTEKSPCLVAHPRLSTPWLILA